MNLIELNADTKLCAVIGNPIGHSLSPRMHNAAYAAAGLNYVYLAFQVSDVQSVLDGMRALPTFRGLSVTIPHKLAVIDHLDALEPLAAGVGSVNTITHEGSRLIGATTDGPGALRAFAERGIPLAGKRAVFLGAGGAVRAVAFAFAMDAGVESITICGRNAKRVARLAEDIRRASSIPVHGCGLGQDMADAVAEAGVFVQGSPLGMAPNDQECPIDPAWLHPDLAVFDMVYRPHETRLLHEAGRIGCPRVFGLDMLVWQGALQFERWTGQAAPYQAMADAAGSALGLAPA